MGRHGDHPAARDEVLDNLDDQGDACPVEVRVRLVEQVDRCLMQEDAREGETLSLTRGELDDEHVEQIARLGGPCETDALECSTHRVLPDRGAVEPGVGEGGSHRPREELPEIRTLRQISDAATEAREVDGGEVDAPDGDGSLLRRA